MSTSKFRGAAFYILAATAILIHGTCNFAIAQKSEQKAEKGATSKNSAGGREKPHRARTISRLPLPQPEIFFCETYETSCRSNADRFAIDDTRELFVFVTVPGVVGEHVETVEFVLPDGEIYQRKKTQFAVGDATSPTNLTNDSVETRPLRVAPEAEARQLIADANLQHESGVPALLTNSRGETTLITVLPIAGTYITQRALAGIWQVRVWLDDQVVLTTTLELYATDTDPNAQIQEDTDKEKIEGRAHSPKP